jgi:hypothetical protein
MKKYFSFLIVLTLFVLGSVEAHAAVSVPSTCDVNTTPSMTILSPNGGEVYQDGQQITVTWKNCNIPADANVYFTLNYLNGSDHGSMSLITGSTLNDGTELITLPKLSVFNSTAGNYYTIGIVYNSSPFATAKNNNQIRDYSDNSFTIKNSTLLERAPCTPGTSAGTLNMKLDSNSPISMKVYLGTNNIELTRIDLTNKGTQNVCLNGIHLGSDFDVNNYINNTNVIDLSTGLNVGQVVNSFDYNGNYYYSWINSRPSLSIKPGETKIFKIVSDVPSTAQQGIFTIGFWGLNFDLPGAHSSPQTINGNKISVVKNLIGEEDPSIKIIPIISSSGCSNGEVYSSTTGQACHVVVKKEDKGCSNGEVYSSTTGIACPAKVIKEDSGCSNGEKYSSTNGQICTEYGCLHGEVYSSTTGIACPAKLIKEDKGCLNGEVYSSTTGKICVISNKTCSTSDGNCMSQAKTTLQRNLKIGVKGEDVKIIQKFLGLNADGVFGKKTAEKVKEWQMMKNLTADGIVGSKTMLLMK